MKLKTKYWHFPEKYWLWDYSREQKRVAIKWVIPFILIMTVFNCFAFPVGLYFIELSSIGLKEILFFELGTIPAYMYFAAYFCPSLYNDRTKYHRGERDAVGELLVMTARIWGIIFLGFALFIY